MSNGWGRPHPLGTVCRYSRCGRGEIGARPPMSVRIPITVAVARFEDLVALGLNALLSEDPSVSVVARDIPVERIGVMVRAHGPQVLILDAAALPDLAGVRALRLQHPGTRLILVGGGLSNAEAAQVLAFGASACLASGTQARDVRNAIHLASRGLQVMPPGSDASGGQATDGLLTPREGDVLLLLRQGRSNAQIALALQIGVETVRTHARSVYRKLGVASRRALIALPTPPPPASPPSAARPTAVRDARPARRRSAADAHVRRQRHS